MSTLGEARPNLFSAKALRRLIIPLIIEQALSYSIGMIDTIMVASAGESAVSGVSLVDSVNFLLVTLFTSLATGGAIVAGQYLGRGERENANLAARELVLTTGALSFLIALVCLALNPQILALLFGSAEADVIANARTYFYVTALSYPFIAVYNASAALFRSMGNSKAAMVNSLIMNLVNIAGNAVFIFGMGWGVFGAALATLISRIIATVTMMVMLRNPKLAVSVRSYFSRRIDWGMVKRILRIGVPSGLENSIFQVGRIIMTGLVATFGTSAIAAHAVGTSLTGIEVIPGQALGLALMTVVAQCLGAGEPEQAKRYTMNLLKQSWLYMILLNTAMLFIMHPILGLYNLADGTRQLAFWIMVLHGAGAMTVWPASFTLPNALRAAGDVRFPMALSIFSMFVFRVGSSFLLAYMTSLGVLSVWIGMLIDWTFRGICFLRRWRSGKWQNKTVIEQ